MASPIMEAARRDQLSCFPAPYLFQSLTCANSYAAPDLYSRGKKNPKSCESASLVLQNAFWKCLCAGMPTRKFERDPAS